jgi:type I restriction enzyme R subunit
MDEAELNEAKTRKMLIDKALGAAGWGPIVPYREDTLCSHGSVEEYPTSKGPADYILFHQGKAIACVEGKKVKVAPMNVLQQAKRYARGFPSGPCSHGSFGEFRIPFIYSTNGKIIWFQDLTNPQNLPRDVAAFHTPQALSEMLSRDEGSPWNWLINTPIDRTTLWPFQIEAIEAIERALINGRRHMLVAMATGTGKTFTIANLIYRLMKSGFAKRILFLVDRRA